MGAWRYTTQGCRRIYRYYAHVGPALAVLAAATACTGAGVLALSRLDGWETSKELPADSFHHPTSLTGAARGDHPVPAWANPVSLEIIGERSGLPLFLTADAAALAMSAALPRQDVPEPPSLALVVVFVLFAVYARRTRRRT